MGKTLVSVRSNTGETPGSRPLQRQEDALMVPNSRACSRGGSTPRDSSGSLASGEKSSPRIVSVRSNTGETPGSRPLERQEDALMAERSVMQESIYSLPGSVPSGPPDGLGIVRESLCQEDTCLRSEHTTNHQKQARISELNRIWDGRKSLLADTALILKDKQNIVLRMARTGTKLVLLNDSRVGDVATGIDGTLVLPLLNVDDVKHHIGKVKTGGYVSYPPTLDKRYSMETTAAYKSICPQYGKSYVKMFDETDAWFSPGKPPKK